MLAKGSGYAEAGAAEGEHARHYPHVFGVIGKNVWMESRSSRVIMR